MSDKLYRRYDRVLLFGAIAWWGGQLWLRLEGMGK